MTKQTLQKWYEKMMAHAKNNYDTNGWDSFVETVSYEDFERLANRPIRAMPGVARFKTYNDALTYYKEWCEETAVRHYDVSADRW